MPMNYIEKAIRVLDLEISELQRLRGRLDESFARAVELIKQTIEARGKVIVLGVGQIRPHRGQDRRHPDEYRFACRSFSTP